LVTDAAHGYFGHGIGPYAPGLKSVRDAMSIRSHILDAFEQAEATDEPAVRRKLWTFLICDTAPLGSK